MDNSKLIENILGESAKVQFAVLKYNSSGEYSKDLLGEVAFMGKGILTLNLDSSSYSFYSNFKSYSSNVLENPLWLEVALCANEAILRTEDSHHIFLENIYHYGEINGIPAYTLSMGS